MMKWVLFVPELFYVSMALVFFLFSLRKKVEQKLLYNTAVILGAVGLVVTVAFARQHGMLFFDAYRVDLFSQVFKVFLALGTFWVIFACSELRGVNPRQHSEFFMLISICTLGMMMLVSSAELLTIYISIELSSYALYLLVPMRRISGDLYVETGIKYFMIGVTASAFMIFGISFIFGVTKSTYVADIARVLPTVISEPAAIIGLILALCGFFFKQALFPFHSWAPDVYQGAANQVTTYIATASKMAAAAMVIRFVGFSGGESSLLVQLLITLSIVSMTFGNLVAIIQKDLKRLLAYSSIAHAGYMLIGILCLSERGFSSAVYYAMAYLVMNFAVFLVIIMVAEDGRNLQIKELAGLHKRSPILALTLMLGLFGLAGIPPTVGFTGKFLVFAAALEKGYLLLVIIGMINATISLYYYLIVIKAAYLLEPVNPYPPVRVDGRARAMSMVLIVAMVYLGLFPDRFVALTEAAARSLP
ncbi:MAG: NADH-quinone oxidoreductase subunit N [Syntrophobacteraceae bacterium]|nr:NADH-quinone oxidoreductase subunit N [Syntrophobacteraceae bacterium]